MHIYKTLLKIAIKAHYICISFFQQCNNVEELHYTTKKEALAMVYVLHKFWHYLLGNKFLFYVHHMTLPYLIKKPQVYRMIAIWLSFFLKCKFSIIYKPRHSHSIANALSRLVDTHYEKKRSFVIGLITQFLSCRKHLQLTVYMMQFIVTQL